jgi:hypothetical protein
MFKIINKQNQGVIILTPDRKQFVIPLGFINPPFRPQKKLDL